MPIEYPCPSCNRLLRVGDEQAGRQARCPQCQTVSNVPEPDASEFPDLVPQETWSSATKWYTKTPDGTQYGPEDKSTIDRWVAEGRINASTQLLEEGASQWRWASEVYPSLGGEAQSGSASVPTRPINPYSSPTTQVSTMPTGRPGIYVPHRGTLILVLGILGIMTCFLLAIPAWIMGSQDLREIRAGRMDPAGQGLTQAGMILGIIGTVLGICCGSFWVIAVVADGM